MKLPAILSLLLLPRILDANPDPEWALERLSVRPAELAGLPGGVERHVYATFRGLPWTRYDLEVSQGLNGWTPIGSAAEAGPGHYSFFHSGADADRFFRATAVLPGPEKTHAAWFAATEMGVSASLHRFAMGYAFETMLGVENVALNLGRTIDRFSDALAGEIVVVEPEFAGGSWRVAWGGQEVFAPDEAARDQAVADFQAAMQQASMDLAAAEADLAALEHYPPLLQGAMAALDTEMQGALADQATIQCLNLPAGVQYIAWQAPLAFMSLQELQVRIAALDAEKAALQDAINKKRTEAQRKRTVADMPAQVFGINGTWYVRWSALEFTFNTRAQAEAFRDGFIANLIAKRRQEADGLDAMADQLETQLQQVCNERDTLAADLPNARDEADDKEDELGDDPAEKPDDDDDERITYKTWIAFDPLYLDWMWIDMFRELQARKDALRTKLQQMGMSPENIAEEMEDWDREQRCRRKVMSVYCDDPIKLELQFYNQFTGYTIDTENATWEVRYRDFSTNMFVIDQLGTGGELCLTPQQTKEIWQRARDIEGFTDLSVVLDFHVKFDRVSESGARQECSQLVQVIITNELRATAEARQEIIRNATPGGYR